MRSRLWATCSIHIARAHAGWVDEWIKKCPTRSFLIRSYAAHEIETGERGEFGNQGRGSEHETFIYIDWVRQMRRAAFDDEHLASVHRNFLSRMLR